MNSTLDLVHAYIGYIPEAAALDGVRIPRKSEKAPMGRPQRRLRNEEMKQGPGPQIHDPFALTLQCSRQSVILGHPGGSGCNWRSGMRLNIGEDGNSRSCAISRNSRAILAS